eukprot:1157338-Pelagomonas_calceolata.AAC.7
MLDPTPSNQQSSLSGEELTALMPARASLLFFGCQPNALSLHAKKNNEAEQAFKSQLRGGTCLPAKQSTGASLRGIDRSMCQHRHRALPTGCSGMHASQHNTARTAPLSAPCATSSTCSCAAIVSLVLLECLVACLRACHQRENDVQRWLRGETSEFTAASPHTVLHHNTAFAAYGDATTGSASAQLCCTILADGCSCSTHAALKHAAFCLDGLQANR